MIAKKALSQQDKRELDRRLDDELEGKFPANDPPKITRSSVKSPDVAGRKIVDRGSHAPILSGFPN